MTFCNCKKTSWYTNDPPAITFLAENNKWVKADASKNIISSKQKIKNVEKFFVDGLYIATESKKKTISSDEIKEAVKSVKNILVKNKKTVKDNDHAILHISKYVKPNTFFTLPYQEFIGVHHKHKDTHGLFFSAQYINQYVIKD